MPSGITLLKQPAAYTPAFSPAWWVASSSNSSAANFKYRVVFTDVITSATFQKDYDKDPFYGDKLIMDSNAFAELYTLPYVPNNVYSFQKCTDGIRQIKVNIGEYYGTTPAYTAGSDVTYYVWNGVLLEDEIPSFLTTDFVYKGSTSNYKYLSTLVNATGRYKPDGKTYADKSQFLYCLSSEANDIEQLQIDTYNAAGTLLGTYIVPNLYTGGTTYTDKYVCIDIGHKGLSGLTTPGDYSVSFGSAPIITSSVAYYDITDLLNVPPLTTRKVYQRIYIECEAKCEVWAAHYWSKTGKFETIHFPKVSKRRSSSNKTSYNQSPYALTAGNDYTFTKFTQTQKVLNSATEQRIDLQTDWLTYEEIEAHKEIIDSPLVYLDFGSTIGLRPCEVETNSYEDKRKFNTGDPAFAITVKLGGTNSKQRG